MSLPLVLALFPLLGDTVTGLRPGETAVVLDPAHALDLEAFVRSRVLNANTGEPVEDVLVEAWTENGEAPRQIEQCIDRAKTNAGGQVEFDAIRHRVRATKIRLSKLGFASATVSLSDMFDQEVSLSPQQPLAGRVLDLEGKPVVGAIVRTRETCAHAVPAAQTRTDSLGRFRLTDCPVGDNDPEIEVLGELIAPLKQLDGGDLRRLAAFHGGLDFYVAKRAPIDMRVVDAKGDPIANRRVVTKFAPMYESWTDDDGLCRMFPPDEGRDATFYIADVGPDLTLASTFVPGVVTTVTPYVFDKGPELPASLRIAWSGLDPAVHEPSATFIPALGGEHWIENDGTKVPAGAGRLVVGGRFDAYAQQDLALDVHPGAQEVPVKLTRNPLLRVTLAGTGFARTLVEAGRDSAALGVPTLDEQVAGSCVPAGVPVRVLTESFDGEIRIANVPPLKADTTLDMNDPKTIVRPGLGKTAAETKSVRFVVTDRSGKPVSGLVGRVWADQVSLEDQQPQGTTFDWPLPSCASYRAAFHAPGYTTLFHQGVVKTAGDVLTIELSMRRRAHVTLRGPISNVIVPGAIPEVTDGAFEIDVAAGPLTLRVIRPDQPPLAVELVIAEGETRKLEVR